MTVRALSLWRPWTELVLGGSKTCENRRWPVPKTIELPFTLVVHGAQHFDWDAIHHAAALLDTREAVLTEALGPHRCATGYLGIVQVVGCTLDMVDQWAAPGQHHWLLADPQPFTAPIPGRGRQGLWTPPAEVLAAVDALGVAA